MRLRPTFVLSLLIARGLWAAPPPPCGDDPAKSATGGLPPQTKAEPTAAAAPTGSNESLRRLYRYIPQDASAVVLIPNMDALITGMAEFGAAIDARSMRTMRIEVLVEQRFPYHSSHVDPTGALAIVFSDTAAEPIILVAMRDDVYPGKSIENSVQLGDAVGVVECDKSMTAFTKDRVLIHAETRAEIDRALTANSAGVAELSPLADALLRDHQFMVVVRPQRWRTEIDRGIALFEAAIQQGVASAGTEAHQAIELWDQIFAGTRMCMGELDMYAAGLRFNKSGLHYGDQFRWKRGGFVGSYLASIKPTKNDLLRGLPQHEFAMLYAAEWNLAPGAQSIMEMVQRQMLLTDQEREKLGPEGTQRVDALISRLHSRIDGMTISHSLSSNPNTLLVRGMYLTSKPAETQADLRELMSALPSFAADLGEDVKCDIECGPITVADKPADGCKLKVSGSPEAMARMKVIYGAEPMYCLCAKGDGVAVSVGSKEASVAALGEMLSDHPPLNKSPRMIRALETISPNPQSLVVVNAPAAANFIAYFIESFGMPSFPFRLKNSDDMPFISIGVYADPAAQQMHVEMFVPSEFVAEAGRVIRPLTGN